MRARADGLGTDVAIKKEEEEEENRSESDLEPAVEWRERKKGDDMEWRWWDAGKREREATTHSQRIEWWRREEALAYDDVLLRTSIEKGGKYW